MVSRGIIIALIFGLSIGCAEPVFIKRVKNRVARFSKKQLLENQVVQMEPPFRQFVATNIDWLSIRRIVLMPLGNQTTYTHVVDEIGTNLATELQRAGRFEVVVASHNDLVVKAQDVFSSGQFNELEVLRVAREYQADAVLFASVTQYHPYSPPRIGVSLLLVSPAEGVAIASLNGLWDAREANTAAQAQAYYKQTLNWSRSLMGAERVIESPDVYQRFVCHQVAVAFYPSATSTKGYEFPRMNNTEGMMPENDGEMPVYNNTMPSGEQAPFMGDPPPMPPAGQ